MLPSDIEYARVRYNDMLAEAEARRLAKAARVTARPESRPRRDKSLIARLFDALRPRLAARA